MKAQTDFFLKVYGIADKLNGKVNPALVAAVACLESNFGKSQLATRANNLFGIKAGAGYRGAFITMPTKEVIKGGTVTIQAKFRKYNSLEDSVKDYLLLMNSIRYSGVKKGASVEDQLKAIARAGYATDPAYFEKVQKVYNQFKQGLSEYGGFIPYVIFAGIAYKLLSKK